MKVGFIGLGAMGRPMAANIAKAGHELSVFDVRPEAVAALTKLGATSASSPRDVAARSDIVSIIVATESQITDVIGTRNSDGLLAGAAKGLTVVIHSTVQPDFCRRLAAQLAEHGVEVIDAAVSGMEMRAEDGSLTLFVGGAKSTVDRLTPLFQAVGNNIFHLGPVGSGMTAKVINNLVSVSNMIALREGLALAAKCGINEATILDIINVSSGESAVSRSWGALQEVWKTQRAGGGPPWNLAVKDAELAVALGQSLAMPLPVAERVAQVIGQLYTDSKK